MYRIQFTERSKTASKKLKDGIVDLNCPIQNNWRASALVTTQKIDSEAWKAGIRDPSKHPNHKKWLKTGTSKKFTIIYKKKFRKQFQNWQKDVKKGVKKKWKAN